MKKKKTYVCPLSEIVPIRVENLLGAGVASYVNHDGGDGNEGIEITPGGGDGPMPGKGWSFDDDDDNDDDDRDNGWNNIWN